VAYRGDERFERNANWSKIREAQRFARRAHDKGFTAEEIIAARGIEVGRVALSPTQLGMLTRPKASIGPGPQGLWVVALNQRLNRREAGTVLLHEGGHSWLTLDKTGQAHCRPRRGRDTGEEMSDAIGALMAVPLPAVERLTLWDDNATAVADRLDVATTYVHMRCSLAVILGEQSGSRQDAFFALELALLQHENWLHAVSQRLRDERPPVSVA
jgi:hypothetical protein